jgi:hypothetical protein
MVRKIGPFSKNRIKNQKRRFFPTYKSFFVSGTSQVTLFRSPNFSNHLPIQIKLSRIAYFYTGKFPNEQLVFFTVNEHLVVHFG